VPILQEVVGPKVGAEKFTPPEFDPQGVKAMAIRNTD